MNRTDFCVSKTAFSFVSSFVFSDEMELGKMDWVNIITLPISSFLALKSTFFLCSLESECFDVGPMALMDTRFCFNVCSADLRDDDDGLPISPF